MRDYSEMFQCKWHQRGNKHAHAALAPCSALGLSADILRKECRSIGATVQVRRLAELLTTRATSDKRLVVIQFRVQNSRRIVFPIENLSISHLVTLY